MRTVRDIPMLENIPVLLRTSLNAPVENGVVTESFRLTAALPTIEYLRTRHAKVVLVSHISGSGAETLEPMYKAMKEWIPNLAFCPVSTGPEARAAVRALSAGGVVMLENLRRNAGEEKNDPAFAVELAELADVFVEDSFDTCHRVHASIVGVPKLLPSYAGLTVEREIAELAAALSPKHPSLAIIGGAKFSTKEPVLARLLTSYDSVFVGGALANDFLKVKGYPVGVSSVSGADDAQIKKLLTNPKVLLPLDVVVASQGAEQSSSRVVELSEVGDTEGIYDIGPKTGEMLAEKIHSARTILWNGPMGLFEKGYLDGTRAVARAVAESDATSVVGGGDTVAVISELKAENRFSFISTGGGAMLDFLVSGSLPGIAVLN
ncbi:MAG: phosphoglycerate kinase [Parcubacteria bacterium C7867-001]|nr:MAG: phosphoglycerate kinase [Parcubacteria bacterium C7867-001]